MNSDDRQAIRDEDTAYLADRIAALERERDALMEEIEWLKAKLAVLEDYHEARERGEE